MMRNLVVAAVAMMAVGCDHAASTDEDVIDEVTKDDGSFPGGVYQNEKAKIGDLSLLELNSDQSFMHMTQGIDCLPDDFGTCGQVTGTYKFSHSTTSDTKYIRFYDSDGNFTVRYAYKMAATTLSLKEDSAGGHWFDMTVSSACQQAGGECVALSPGSCKGEVGDARQYSCGGGLGVECCFAN